MSKYDLPGSEGFTEPHTRCSINLEFDKYDDKKVCEGMLEFHINTYYSFDLLNPSPEIINIDGVDISMFYWRPSSGYIKSYIFEYNNCIYRIEFSFGDETLYMSENSEKVINSIVFTGEKITETESTENIWEEETETEIEYIEEETEPEDIEQEETEKAGREYLINYNSGKYHKPTCYTMDDATNCGTYYGTAEELEAQGYVACKKCNPY